MTETEYLSCQIPVCEEEQLGPEPRPGTRPRSDSDHRSEKGSVVNGVSLSGQSKDFLIAFNGNHAEPQVDPAGVRWLRPGLRKYSHELSVDPNTINWKIKLSDNNRTMTYVGQDQQYPDHPGRFQEWHQLFCQDGLTGRCYWELESRGFVNVSVSYKGNGGEDWLFGRNHRSWRQNCSDGGFTICHGNVRTFSSWSSGRVAVYVDYPAGSLSLFKVSSDKLIHLHSFRIRFSEPLHPGFGFGFMSGSSVSLCSTDPHQQNQDVEPGGHPSLVKVEAELRKTD